MNIPVLHKYWVHVAVLLSIIFSTAGCGSAVEDSSGSSVPGEVQQTEQVSTTEQVAATENPSEIQLSTDVPQAQNQGELYKHSSGAFQMLPFGKPIDEGLDYVVFEGDQGLVLAIYASLADPLEASNAVQLIGQALDSYLVGTELATSYQLNSAPPESLNNGFLARFDATTKDGSNTSGAIYLRKDGGTLYTVMLLTAEYGAAEATFRQVAESFKPGANSIEISQAEVDSGFRPGQNGFSFPNYGDEPGMVNLTAAEMRRMFGDRVCASLAGGECILTPPAHSWMDQINTNMKGGHCEGMAVLSELMYYGLVDPNQFGGATAHELSIQNEALQREIAYWFTTQFTQPGGQNKVNETPVKVVEVLQKALKAGVNAQESYAVGIYKRDGSGGHAVTPIGVDDKGGGLFDILVYDNNMPNQVRAIQVDANANTWKYEASINPNEPLDTYEGDASTQSLEVVSLSPRTQEQVCDFCGTGGTASRAGRGLAQTAPENYEVWLDGPANLLITDDQGRRIGYTDGQFVNEIPNASTERVKLGVDVWDTNYEPIYQIPASATFVISIDAGLLTEPSTSTVTVIGQGFYLEVADIYLKPQEVDQIGITKDGKQFFLSYMTDYTETPEIYLGIETEAADYAFLAQATQLTGQDDTLNVGLDLTAGTFFLSTLTNKEPGIFNFYVLRIDEEGESAFGTEDYTMQPDATIHLEYNAWPGNGNPMQAWLDTNDDGQAEVTLQLPDTSDQFYWE
jgi:hypothetical protein